MNYYDPTDVNVDDLITRVRVSRSTEELIRTPTGSSLISRATQDYREGIEALQKMAMQEWVGSSEEPTHSCIAIFCSASIPSR